MSTLLSFSSEATLETRFSRSLIRIDDWLFFWFLLINERLFYKYFECQSFIQASKGRSIKYRHVNFSVAIWDRSLDFGKIHDHLFCKYVHLSVNYATKDKKNYKCDKRFHKYCSYYFIKLSYLWMLSSLFFILFVIVAEWTVEKEK